MKKITAAFLALVLTSVAAPSLMAQSGKPVLNHIALYVQDLKKSSAFYHEVVQLDTIPEPFHDGKHTWFAIAASSHLHLIEGSAETVKHDKNGHLCFSVPSVREVVERLNKNGVAFYNWAGDKGAITTRVDGIQQIYFNDPDGYWIEINSDYPKQ